MGRRASGIERITDMLFSAAALAPLEIAPLEASGGRMSMLLQQIVGNPLKAVRNSQAICVFPGYPPSPMFRVLPDRTVLYVHDLFLLTRKQDLNWAATIYLSPLFKAALSRLRYFLVNSETTGRHLAQYVSEASRIQPYRPPATDVFRLKAIDNARVAQDGDRRGGRPLIVGALGTVEPRKNFLAAASICAALAKQLDRQVELHIVGRSGWGNDFAALSRLPFVKLHGFLSDADARQVISGFDLFLCSSHDEGLGLPLLEMQYAGLQIVAPDQPVFREVLGESGLFVDVADAGRAAHAMREHMAQPEWQTQAADAAERNLARWNRQAEQDRADVVQLLSALRDKAAARKSGQRSTRDKGTASRVA